MKFHLIKTPIFLLFFVLYSFGASAKKTEVNYIIEVGGLDIGNAQWIININDQKYSTHLYLEDAGIFSRLYKFKGRYFADGNIESGLFVSSKYIQTWKTKKKERKVTINFSDKRVTNITLFPQENVGPKVDYLDIKELIDPLSSFLNILLGAGDKFSTVDGRRLYKMLPSKQETKEGTITTRIKIKNYQNIWANHNKNDLSYIEIEKLLTKKNIIFPYQIKIKHMGLVYKLTKI